MVRHPKITDQDRRRYALQAAQRGAAAVAREIGYEANTVRKWMRKFDISPQSVSAEASFSPEAMSLKHDRNSASDAEVNLAGVVAELNLLGSCDEGEIGFDNLDGQQRSLAHALFRQFQTCRAFETRLGGYWRQLRHAMDAHAETDQRYALATRLKDSDDPDARNLADEILGEYENDIEALSRRSDLVDLIESLPEHLEVGFRMDLDAQGIQEASDAETRVAELIHDARGAAADSENNTAHSEASRINQWLEEYDELDEIRAAVHPGVTDAQIGKLLRHRRWTVRVTAAALNPSVTAEWIEHILDGRYSPDIRAAAVSNANCTAEILDRVLQDESITVRTAVAQQPKLAGRQLQTMLGDPDPVIRGAAAKNPNLTPALLSELLDDSSAYVRALSACHPACTQDQVSKALQDEDATVRMSALEHPNASSDQIDRAINGEDSDMWWSVLMNPKITSAQATAAAEKIAAASDGVFARQLAMEQAERIQSSDSHLDMLQSDLSHRAQSFGLLGHKMDAEDESRRLSLEKRDGG